MRPNSVPNSGFTRTINELEGNSDLSPQSLDLPTDRAGVARKQARQAPASGLAIGRKDHLLDRAQTARGHGKAVEAEGYEG